MKNRRWIDRSSFDGGGQADVFLVRDGSGEHQGQYVLKKLKKSKNQETRKKRFEREIYVTRALHKSGCPVIEIVDAGAEDEELPYMVSKYYGQGNLRKRAPEFTNSLPTALDFVEKLAAALRCCHEITTHRDLKPENILLDDDGAPVLCDFGLCFPLGEDIFNDQLTPALEQIGSRHYTAPEAYAGMKPETNMKALDVYSFGKIAYELAAGNPLPGFEGPTGEYDLMNSHPGENDWYLFNRMVADLVSVDPEQRMVAWGKLGQTISKIRTIPRAITGGDAHAYALAVQRRLAESRTAEIGKKEREWHARRDAYKNRLREAAQEGFAREERLNELQRLANEEDSIVIERTTGESQILDQLAGYIGPGANEARDGNTLSGVTIRLRDGAKPENDHLVFLDTDVIWRNNFHEFRITLILTAATYDLEKQAKPFRILNTPQPFLVHLDWASVGEEAMIAEVGIKANEIATRMADMVTHLLSS